MNSTTRLFLLVASLGLTACSQPFQRYHFAPLSGSPEERTDALARAFAAAGSQPQTVDARLRMVATDWKSPNGDPQWSRRWVAIIADSGEVTLRGEIRLCSYAGPCSEMKESTPDDVATLDSFAHRLGEALGVAVSVLPAS